MGCYEVSLGDTIGVGTAGSVQQLLREVVKVTKPENLALHFHDTYGQGLSNLLAGLEVCMKKIFGFFNKKIVRTHYTTLKTNI